MEIPVAQALVDTGLWKWVMTATGIRVLVNAPSSNDDPNIEVLTGLSFEKHRCFVVEFGRNTLDTLFVKMVAKGLQDTFANFTTLPINQDDGMLYIGNRLITTYKTDDLYVDDKNNLIHQPTKHVLWHPN